MPAIAIYGHPFSSYTQKVLIALYESGTPFELCCIGPDTPLHVAQWLKRWPLGKFPVLVEGDRSVAESSIIIEYLQQQHRGAQALLPAEPQAALEVRFMDRFFDYHVMDAMQVAIEAAIKRLPIPPEQGVQIAAQRLQKAYAWLDVHLAGRGWAAGEAFSLADCAAAPSLFYADWVHRIPVEFAVLRAYRARLLARPSVARAVDEARPHRHLFPLGAPDRD